MFEIEYEFREQDLIHFNELQLERSEEIQKNIRKNRLMVPSIMMLIAGFYYYYYGQWMSAAYIGFIAVLWGILSPRIIKLDLRRQILTNYSYKEKAKMFGLYNLSIDKDFLIDKSPGGKHKTAWTDVLRVEYVKGYVFIYVDLTTALVVPVETIKSGNLEEFAEQVEKMIERAD